MLIVESENDKFFVEALIAHININVEVGNPICTIDEYNCMGGMGKLKNRLEELKSRLLKGDEINQVGIIFDADKVGVDERIKQIDDIKDSVFASDELDLKIFIINIDGNGELETLLKEIKSINSPIADCLESWQECLADKKLNKKDFDKLWIQIYQRYDCCTKKEQKQAGEKCNNEVSLKSKSIYNFDKDCTELVKLKEFLEGFGD
ncbi:MAG: DUF3226 domain-containing protein [Campylobacterota bacterium]|nr:DUF3226 domain-containing protein [Campylobacterota bacterium]